MDYGGVRFSQATGLDERWFMKKVSLIADRLKPLYIQMPIKSADDRFIPTVFIEIGLIPIGLKGDRFQSYRICLCTKNRVSRYESADQDPDLCQNVTEAKQWNEQVPVFYRMFSKFSMQKFRSLKNIIFCISILKFSHDSSIYHLLFILIRTLKSGPNVHSR
jgi:hypothetical protein